MRQMILMLVIVLASGLTKSAFANNLLDVTNDVKAVCTQPSTQGEHWDATADANGSVGLQVKLLRLANVGGDLHFSKEEWSGIQMVLAHDQAGDNASYRTCVQALVPQFLSKIPASQ